MTTIALDFIPLPTAEPTPPTTPPADVEPTEPTEPPSTTEHTTQKVEKNDDAFKMGVGLLVAGLLSAPLLSGTYGKDGKER